jgi:glucuronoarabinoxylan endo-1,4-beta-xylanase
VFVTAYAGSGHHVIVAINMGSSAVNQPFTIQGATVSSLVPHQTSNSQNLAQLAPVTVSNGTFTYSLPGQSITTFAD